MKKEIPNFNIKTSKKNNIKTIEKKQNNNKSII